MSSDEDLRPSTEELIRKFDDISNSEGEGASDEESNDTELKQKQMDGTMTILKAHPAEIEEKAVSHDDKKRKVAELDIADDAEEATDSPDKKTKQAEATTESDVNFKPLDATQSDAPVDKPDLAPGLEEFKKRLPSAETIDEMMRPALEWAAEHAEEDGISLDTAATYIEDEFLELMKEVIIREFNKNAHK